MQDLLIKKIRVCFPHTLSHYSQCGMLDKEFLETLSSLGQKVVGLQLWNSEAEIDVNEYINQFSEANKEALRLYRLAEEKEAEGLPMEAVRLFSRAFKMNPDLEEVVNSSI